MINLNKLKNMLKINNILKRNHKTKIESPKFYDILSIPSTPEDLFTLQYPIGHGAFGTVYKAVHNSTNKIYAIKIIDYSKDNNKDNNNIINYNYNSVQQETSLMRKVNTSDYIVKYYGSYFSRKTNTIWLILEYCSSGSAIDLMLSMDRTFSEVEVATMMEMILKGLILMHSENLIHRDIKGANILISEEGYAKLGDFGVGAVLSEEKYRISKKGSPYWMSPQVASCIKYDFKTDIWSLGITCVELLEGEPPFSEMNPKNVMDRISKKPPSAKEIIDLNEHTPEFKSFLEHCLEKDPKKRASATDLLKHEFITKFSKGRKYLEKLVKKHQQDVEKFRIESEEEYQNLIKKNEVEKNIGSSGEDSTNNNNEYNNKDICTYEEGEEFFNKNYIIPNGTYQENIIFDNLDSIDNKMQKFLNNHKKEDEKKMKINSKKGENISLLVCYTESINTLEGKSSVSKEKDNIIIMDKNIQKKKIKKSKDENLIRHIMQLIKNDNTNNKNTPKNNDKLNLTCSYIKSSTSSNSRGDCIDKKDLNDNYIIENINEEMSETKREKMPRGFSYNSNNISYINGKNKKNKKNEENIDDGKNKKNEENIDDDDDEGLIRQSNESINSMKGIESYKNQRESDIQNYNNISYK